MIICHPEGSRKFLSGLFYWMQGTRVCDIYLHECAIRLCKGLLRPCRDSSRGVLLEDFLMHLCKCSLIIGYKDKHLKIHRYMDPVLVGSQASYYSNNRRGGIMKGYVGDCVR